jgi:hypothetical protein
MRRLSVSTSASWNPCGTDYINATEALRVWEGQMEWIMRCEEWFLVEVEEIAMDPRR